MFEARNLQKYANGLLVIGCRFNLVKIKLMHSFQCGKNLSELNIKQFHIVEYLGCCLDANLSVESMAVNFLKKIIQS